FQSPTIGIRDIPQAHQLQSSKGIVHGASPELLRAVLDEGLKAWSVQVADHVAVLDRFFSLGQVADHLDNVEAVVLDVGAFHQDVAQAQDVHAHRPDFRLAADDADEGEGQGV